MKRIRADADAIVFQLSSRERGLLVQILQQYPAVPPAHHSVSKELKGSHVAEYQRLLDDALAEQRAANKCRVNAWLAAPERFQGTKSGYRFSLKRADSEWLLQVLNDLRVGHWVGLGSPDSSELRPLHLDSRLLPTWLTMEMSGYFQVNILEALEH